MAETREYKVKFLGTDGYEGKDNGWYAQFSVSVHGGAPFGRCCASRCGRGIMPVKKGWCDYG